jgi:hypothetical protein
VTAVPAPFPSTLTSEYHLIISCRLCLTCFRNCDIYTLQNAVELDFLCSSLDKDECTLASVMTACDNSMFYAHNGRITASSSWSLKSLYCERTNGTLSMSPIKSPMLPSGNANPKRILT